jgi:curved DNA-binding protein CbpA
MEDAFSLFGLERRPQINGAELKEKYLRLAATRHPDLSDGDDEEFHLLQDAYKTLRDPAARLRHLMELEFPAGGSQNESALHSELFMCAGSAVQAAKAVFLRLESTTTALARALLAPEIVAALGQVREAKKTVQQTEAQLTARLENLDARWPKVSSTELAVLASSFTFISRWMSQLSEWEFRLANG